MDICQTAMDVFKERLQTDDEALLKDMASRVEQVQIPKGTELFREGGVLRDCYFLLDGVIRIYYMMDGEEITEALIDRRGTIIYPSVAITFTEDVANGSVVALTDCVLLHMHVEDLSELKYAYPEFVNIHLGLLLQFVEHSFRLKRQLTHMSPTERYLWFAENCPQLLENVPQKYIASFLGMTPVSLSRIRGRIREKDSRDA